MKKKGLLSVVLATCLVGVIMVGATFAYFQDTTEEVVNTFTVGNVKIMLTEPGWKGGDNLVPGIEVPKDPQISNTGKSAAYVVMKITGMDKMAEKGFSATYDSKNWDRVDAQGKVNNTDKFALADGYYVYKGGALAPEASTAPLFKHVILSEDVKEIAGESYKIMGMLEDAKGLFSYEDASGAEIKDNLKRQPTVFNEDGTPKVSYVINGIDNQVFDSVADAEDYIKTNVKEDVSFKFDLKVQGFAIQTTFEENGQKLPFDPYTNWFTKLIK